MTTNPGATVPRLTTRAIRGMLWMTAGAGGQILLQLLVLAVLARLVTPEEFGVVAVTLIAVSLTQILVDSGVGPALVQMRILTPAHIRVAFTLSVSLAVTAWAVIALGAPTLQNILGVDGVTSVLRIIALVVVIQSLTLGEFLLARRLEFRWLALVDLVAYLVGYGMIAIALALAGFGEWAIVGGQLGQATVRTTVFTVLGPHPRKPLLRRPEARELLSYGGGHTLARIANWLAREGDNFIVGRTLGAAALGLYTRAYQMMALPANLFGKAADQVLFPAMATVQNDKAKLARAYLRTVMLIALVALPASATAAVVSTEAIVVLLGADWLPLKAAFDIMVFGILFRTSYKVSDSLARATGAVYRRAWRQGCYAGLVLVGAGLGQVWSGIRGVAVGVLVALTVNFLLMAQLSLTIVGAHWRQFGRAHLPGLVAAGFSALIAAYVSALLRSIDMPPVVILVCVPLAVIAIAVLGTRFSLRLPYATGLGRAVDDLAAALDGRGSKMIRLLLGPTPRVPERDHVDV